MTERSSVTLSTTESGAVWAAAKRFASADPRSLGVFRIALGVLLFLDAARRYPDIEAHYANTGWLPNHFMLFRPMSDYLFSLYLTCSSPGQVKALLALQLLVDLLLIVGFRTRTMHVLAAVLLASLNSRNIMIENGGWVVLTLLTVWSMFLPLGRRFSVDAFLQSLHAVRESALPDLNQPLKRDATPVVSLAVLALVLEWAAIYAFNVVQKTGAPWRDGTAVYYALHQTGMLSGVGAWLGGNLSLASIRILTFGALAIEAAVACLLLVPLKTQLTRMVAWVLACCLHLSILTVMHLGTFSSAMAIMFFALVPREAWDWLGKKLESRRPQRELVLDGENAFSLALCRVIKRFDTLSNIRFLPAAADQASEIVVLDPSSGQRAIGLAGLVSLAKALPLGAASVWCFRLPGISSLVERAIIKAGRDRAQLASYFELGSARAPTISSASAAETAIRTLWSRLGEGTVLALLVACGSQLLLENPVVPERFRPQNRPVWMSALVIYPRLFQGWSMFAPAPPLDDVAVVVDGRTKDGRHFDPLTGREPSFDFAVSTRHQRNCEWYYFDRHLSEDRFRVYLPGVRDFLRNHHQITGRPQDELVAFDVWSISEQIVLPGAPKSAVIKDKVLSFGTVKD